MSRPSDRNLLIGVLALQLDFVTRDQMIRAFQAWMFDKATPVDELLVAHNAIDPATRDLILALVETHLSRHGNDVEQSLAGLSAVKSSVVEELDALRDPDLTASLNSVRARSGSGHAVPSIEEIPTTLGHAGEATGRRFYILRPHAQGGLGRVSVALDRELNREVALKEIREEQADDLSNRERFKLEAEITGQLEHPGIIPVYGLGAYGDGRPYYAMRFIRGDSLQQAAQQFHERARASGKHDFQSMEFRRLIRRLVDVCNAIEYAHSRGVLHRDLKPGNIMLGKYGETLVVDWGLAKAGSQSDSRGPVDEPTLRPLAGSGSVETMMGQAIGTPAFMSPEQASGQIDQLRPASDVYSLGATLYYLLTGQYSVRGDHSGEVLEKVRKGDVTRAAEVVPAVPKPLNAICEKAMKLNPQSRYDRAVLLADDLEFWLAGEPVSVYKETWPVRLGRFLRRHRTLVIGSLAVLVTATIGLGLVSYIVTSKNADLRVARDLAEDNRRQAEAETVRAEENLATARSIALNILEIAEQNLSTVPGKEGFRDEMMDRCYALFEHIHGQEPNDRAVADEFAKVARMSGNVKRFLRQYPEGRARLLKSVGILENLSQGPAGNHAQRNYLTATYRDLGTLEKAAGDLETASEYLNVASGMVHDLTVVSPGDLELQRTQGTIDLELVGLNVDLLKLDDALASATRCVKAYEPLVKAQNPPSIDVVVYLLALGRQIQLLNRMNRCEEAVALYGTHSEFATHYASQNADPNVQHAFSRLLLRSAEGLLDRSPESPDAAERAHTAQETYARLAERFPKVQAYKSYFAECLRVSAACQSNSDGSQSARDQLTQACAIFEKLVEETKSTDHRDQLARTYTALAHLCKANNEPEPAREWLSKAVQAAAEAHREQPANLDLKQRLDEYQAELKALE